MKHEHILVTIYSRPWWNWFRKTFFIRCWKCDIEIDPLGGRLAKG